MNCFKPGEFAVLEGQIVEIISVLTFESLYNDRDIYYKIRLMNDPMVHRIHHKRLERLENQKTAKILFSEK